MAAATAACVALLVNVVDLAVDIGVSGGEAFILG